MGCTAKQKTKETRKPLLLRPCRPTGYDFEYERNGTANLFMICAPLDGWRHVKVTDRRIRQYFASLLKDLADVHFPGEIIGLVMNNPNPQRSRRLAGPPQRFRETRQLAVPDRGRPQ